MFEPMVKFLKINNIVSILMPIVSKNTVINKQGDIFIYLLYSKSSLPLVNKRVYL